MGRRRQQREVSGGRGSASGLRRSAQAADRVFGRARSRLLHWLALAALVALGLTLASVLESHGPRLGASDQTAQRLQSEQTAIDSAWRQAQTAHSKQADYSFRQAVRAEQVTIYQLATDPGLEAGVLRDLGDSPRSAGLREAIDGLHALWRSAGITDLRTVMLPRHNHSAQEAAPVATLLGYYHAASVASGVDWSVLAAMNYIESDFGRSVGPSSAGAEGPMQFLPSTWRDYGSGDIMNAHDAIMSAASYLRQLGAPANYDRAILGYNHDRNYLAAVKDFAAALRSDPLWLQRLYYWSTYG